VKTSVVPNRASITAVAKFRPGAGKPRAGGSAADPLRASIAWRPDRRTHAAPGKRADASLTLASAWRWKTRAGKAQVDRCQAGRAADQHVDTMSVSHRPKAAPQSSMTRFNHTARRTRPSSKSACRRRLARSDIEPVSQSLGARRIPAKKTIDPNDFGFAAETIELILVNDEKMIADFVERTGVPPCERGALPRHAWPS
jgi:hypothetical protein